MYKNSLGVFLRSAGMALVLGVVSAMASSCGGNKENNEPEPVKEVSSSHRPRSRFR